MKLILTVLVLSASTLVFANKKGLNAVNVKLASGRLAADLQKQYGPSRDAVEASEILSQDLLTFETTESASDFKILLNDGETPAAKKVSLNASKRDISAHEIDKLAILKEQLVSNQLSALRMKAGTVKFFASKSVVNSDLNSLTCHDCEKFGAANNFAYSVKSPRDAGSGLSTGRRLIEAPTPGEEGSGIATGSAAKIVFDRDTGRSKGRIATVSDDDLVSAWVDLFLGESEQEIVVYYEKFDPKLMSEYQNAKSVKLIVPVAMDKGIRLIELGFAIKENGIKIAIAGEEAEITMTVINKSKSNVKNN